MVVNEYDAAIVPTRPGLTALVVYLRPAQRGRLLRVLADLGIFVVEHQGPANALATAYNTRSDFLIVVGGNQSEHATLAHELLSALSSVLVAIVPPETPSEPYLEQGATAVIDETVPDAEFGNLIGPAVRRARWLRNVGEIAAEYVIFRDILFRTMPPQLERQGLSVSLSRVETEVLVELSRSLGRPVRSVDLERRVASLSSRTEIHAGYVKTIILRIRRKVEELGGSPDMLRNIRGIGYMLVA